MPAIQRMRGVRRDGTQQHPERPADDPGRPAVPVVDALRSERRDHLAEASPEQIRAGNEEDEQDDPLECLG